MSRWGLDPERCLAITMADDAMAPTILSGCSILGDMADCNGWPIKSICYSMTASSS